MTKIKVKTILYTKDGRKIGNAIVLKSIDGILEIKTDYGNILRLNEEVCKTFFYIGKLARRDHKHLQSNKGPLIETNVTRLKKHLFHQRGTPDKDLMYLIIEDRERLLKENKALKEQIDSMKSDFMHHNY